MTVKQIGEEQSKPFVSDRLAVESDLGRKTDNPNEEVQAVSSALRSLDRIIAVVPSRTFVLAPRGAACAFHDDNGFREGLLGDDGLIQVSAV
jgi:hypothetical protein